MLCFSEYVFGPRLTPLLTGTMILVHIFLPVFHAYSFYVVYSYLNGPSERYYGASAPAMGNGNGANGGAMNGGGQKKCGNLCQKCQLAAVENGANRCSSTPLIKPIETTC